MPTARLLCLISLLTASACCMAGLSEAESMMAKAKSASDVAAALKEADRDLPPEEKERLNGLLKAGSWKEVRWVFRSVAAAIRLPQDSRGLDKAPAKAKEILSDIRYRGRSAQMEENWLAASLQAFVKWVARVLETIVRLLIGNRSSEEGLGALGALGPGLTVIKAVVIIIVVAAVAAAAFLLVRAKWIPRRRRTKAGGLLEEDEPERNSDEWLSEADRLAGEGRLREAVRCLYLASLVRMDEANLLAFHRWETNWEHLNRFEASPSRPPAINLRSATKVFDLVWYGSRLRGAQDLDDLRGLYQSVLSAVREAA